MKDAKGLASSVLYNVLRKTNSGNFANIASEGLPNMEIKESGVRKEGLGQHTTTLPLKPNGHQASRKSVPPWLEVGPS